jgi:hypothetical protein
MVGKYLFLEQNNIVILAISNGASVTYIQIRWFCKIKSNTINLLIKFTKNV